LRRVYSVASWDCPFIDGRSWNAWPESLGCETGNAEKGMV